MDIKIELANKIAAIAAQNCNEIIPMNQIVLAVLQ